MKRNEKDWKGWRRIEKDWKGIKMHQNDSKCIRTKRIKMQQRDRKRMTKNEKDSKTTTSCRPSNPGPLSSLVSCSQARLAQSGFLSFLPVHPLPTWFSMVFQYFPARLWMFLGRFTRSLEPVLLVHTWLQASATKNYKELTWWFDMIW